MDFLKSKCLYLAQKKLYLIDSNMAFIKKNKHTHMTHDLIT